MRVDPDDDDDDDDDDDEVDTVVDETPPEEPAAGTYGPTTTGFPPPLEIAWAVVSNDPAGTDTPLAVHEAAVRCLVRAMDGYSRGS